MNKKETETINMKNTPVDYDKVKYEIANSGLPNIGRASIREIRRLIDNIENSTGKKFIRMEMGIPGFPACKIGVECCTCITK